MAGGWVEFCGCADHLFIPRSDTIGSAVGRRRIVAVTNPPLLTIRLAVLVVSKYCTHSTYSMHQPLGPQYPLSIELGNPVY